MDNQVERLKEIINVLKKYDLPKKLTPKNVRLAIEDLGPTFIKMGQILSSREDLLPKEYCIELQKLRSQVKPMEEKELKEILEKEYNNFDEIFSKFNYNPIGSASIAQVHKAKLKDNSIVAVKVKRNNIEEKMSEDTQLIKKAINVLHLNKLTGNIIDLNQVIDEMYDTAKEEMNFEIELNHIEEFASNNKDIPYLKTLKVYKEISSKNILVMEYIKGINIDDSNSLIQKEYNLDKISYAIANNYIKQALEDGFYHADPHPDNIKIINDKICYLDFGMMGRLSNYNKELLIQAATSIIKNDVNKLSHILLLMDTKQNDNTDYMKLKREISLLLERNKKQEIVEINIIRFSSELFKLLQENQITLPKEITMLIRGIVVLEGTLEKINPNITLMQVFINYFSNSKLIDTKEIKDQIVQVLNSSKDVVELPKETLSLLKGINTGELRFNIELTDSKHNVDRIEEIVHLLMVTALDVAFIIATSTISNKDNVSFLFYIYLISSIICTLWLIYKLIISKFKRFK